MTRAVILAAGRGSRLGGSPVPKCLCEVGGQSLLAHQLRALARVGVTEVCVVAGYKAEAVEAACQGLAEGLPGMDLRCLTNTRYTDTDSISSLCLAQAWASAGPSDLFVLNSDVLAHPKLYEQLARTATTAILVDRHSGHDDEHMKVRIDADRVCELSKGLPASSVQAENVGIAHVIASDVARYFELALEVAARTDAHVSASAAISALAMDRKVTAVDVAELPWIEIDFADDLERARGVIWPAMVAQVSNEQNCPSLGVE